MVRFIRASLTRNFAVYLLSVSTGEDCVSPVELRGSERDRNPCKRQFHPSQLSLQGTEGNGFGDISFGGLAGLIEAQISSSNSREGLERNLRWASRSLARRSLPLLHNATFLVRVLRRDDFTTLNGHTFDGQHLVRTVPGDAQAIVEATCASEGAPAPSPRGPGH